MIVELLFLTLINYPVIAKYNVEFSKSHKCLLSFGLSFNTYFELHLNAC